MKVLEVKDIKAQRMELAANQCHLSILFDLLIFNCIHCIKYHDALGVEFILSSSKIKRFLLENSVGQINLNAY